MRTAPNECVECFKPSIDGLTHTRCKTSFSLDGLYSPWVYEGVIKRAIISLKYKFAYEIAKELATVLESKIRKTFNPIPSKSFLTVIPLHNRRERWRGFNQSAEIAILIVEKMGWRFVPDLLVRTINTHSQTGLSGKERRKNLKNVFEFNKKYKDLNLQSVVIFDDVCTTGTTLKEAGKILKKLGARSVWGLTIAK